MKNLRDELSGYIKSSRTDYGKFHDRILGNSKKQILIDFLHSSMDEVRLINDDKYADSVLSILGAYPLAFFRKAVLRREISSDIDYTRQRDHSAHTLNNYLLGWYFFSNSSAVKQSFISNFGEKLKGEKLKNEILRECFGNIWPYSSLAHDVGYLLEGGIEADSTEIKSKKVERGLAVMDDYFNHKFWRDIKFSSLRQRKMLLRMSGVEMPIFKSKSMAGVADSLIETGDLDLVRKQVEEELLARNFFVPKELRHMQALSGDAFDLWISYYNSYSNKNMAKRIENLRTAYENYLWEGHPKTGTRLLDHGVSGGLIILLAQTLFYRFYFGLPDVEPSNKAEAKVWKQFKRDTIPADSILLAHWWWILIVWATAATALHNIQQEPRPWRGCTTDTGPLKLNEDPLAYLGILVDILQEWDRYSVSKQAVFTEDVPIQSKDICIGVDKEIITIDFGDSTRADKVMTNLKLALHNWNKIVSLKG